MRWLSGEAGIGGWARRRRLSFQSQSRLVLRISQRYFHDCNPRRARPRISLPANANGIASACTGVGFVNFSLVMARSNLGSSLRSWKLEELLFCVALLETSILAGMSFSSSFLFFIVSRCDQDISRIRKKRICCQCSFVGGREGRKWGGGSDHEG
jgi:hypothetical protein